MAEVQLPDAPPVLDSDFGLDLPPPPPPVDDETLLVAPPPMDDDDLMDTQPLSALGPLTMNEKEDTGHHSEPEDRKTPAAKEKAAEKEKAKKKRTHRLDKAHKHQKPAVIPGMTNTADDKIRRKLEKEVEDEDLVDGPSIDSVGVNQIHIEKTKLMHKSEKKHLPQQSYFTGTRDQAMKYKIAVPKIIRPNLQRAAFRPDDVAFNLVARGHNAVRFQTTNMIEMLDALRGNHRHVGAFDIGQFFIWWDLYASFLGAHFEAEQTAIISVLSQHGDLPSCVHKERRKLVAETLTDYLQQCAKARKNAVNRPPYEPLEKLIDALAELNPFLDYMTAMEKALPEILKNTFDPRSLRMLEKDYVSALCKKGSPDLSAFHPFMFMEGLESNDLAYTKKKCFGTFSKMGMSLNARLYKDKYESVVLYFVKMKHEARKDIDDILSAKSR
mmetsp:Transcript_17158/g.43897  ORF Transcript_17158/g.43897 Transcript_17158/m.43897 type:complete len:441 (-) Transcript_17158:112-1434(-)